MNDICGYSINDSGSVNELYSHLKSYLRGKDISLKPAEYENNILNSAVIKPSEMSFSDLEKLSSKGIEVLIEKTKDGESSLVLFGKKVSGELRGEIKKGLEDYTLKKVIIVS